MNVHYSFPTITPRIPTTANVRFCGPILVVSTFTLLRIWVLRLSFQLLFPHLRMIESTGDFHLETWVQSFGINTSGSFSSPRKCERFHGTKVSLTGTGAIVQKFQKANHPPENSGISEGGHGENTHASAWKVSAVLCGGDYSCFQKCIYYGSGSSDDSALGFWRMELDTLNLNSRSGISDSYILWSFRPVSRLVRLKLRNREQAVRLAINIEGYTREIAVPLIKQRIDD